MSTCCSVSNPLWWRTEAEFRKLLPCPNTYVHNCITTLYDWLCFTPQFTGLSVTSGFDQMVALHTSSQDDVLVCLQRGELCPNQDRVGELVGAMVDHFTRSVPQRHTVFPPGKLC